MMKKQIEVSFFTDQPTSLQPLLDAVFSLFPDAKDWQIWVRPEVDITEDGEGETT